MKHVAATAEQRNREQNCFNAIIGREKTRHTQCVETTRILESEATIVPADEKCRMMLYIPAWWIGNEAMQKEQRPPLLKDARSSLGAR